MKALLCYNDNDFRIEQVETPTISSKDMLVEVLYCGLCGSDIIKIFDQTLRKPDIYGHEIVGKVIHVGKDVTKFKVGDFVVAGHHIPCGSCHLCQHGNETMCEQFKKTNFVPGGFAQYIKLSDKHIENTTFKLPDNFKSKPNILKALFVEPLACCIRAMDRIETLPSDVFSIAGIGAIGILFLQLIKLKGLKAVVIDLDSSRLELAKNLGADLAINPSDCDPNLKSPVSLKNSISGKIREIFPEGVDSAILTVTNKYTINDAISYIRLGGSINIFGMSEKETMIAVDFEKVYKNELTIKSTYSATPNTLKKAYELIINGKINVEPLISEIFPLAEFKKGLDMMLNKKIYKAIFKI